MSGNHVLIRTQALTRDYEMGTEVVRALRGCPPHTI
jgi:hypothetical protein